MTMTETMKAEHLHKERWEDEGGATVGIEIPRSAGRFVRPLLKMAGFQDIPRQWNRKFIIEPIQVGLAFGSSKREATSRD